MDMIKILGVATCLGALAACTTPQERAADAQADAFEAQEGVAKKRIHLVEQYQSCVNAAGGDQQKAAACDSYLKAAEALK
jgi:homoaconitase/3-isopropylmalate dehydratase large subunit